MSRYIRSFRNIVQAFFLRNLMVRNVGITDGRDLFITPLRLAPMPLYTCQVSLRLVLPFKSQFGGYTYRHTDIKGDLISLLLFFQKEESELKMVCTCSGARNVTAE
jgi:hypothetical protein